MKVAGLVERQVVERQLNHNMTFQVVDVVRSAGVRLSNMRELYESEV